jgi:hypothetical protein
VVWQKDADISGTLMMEVEGPPENSITVNDVTTQKTVIFISLP